MELCDSVYIADFLTKDQTDKIKLHLKDLTFIPRDELTFKFGERIYNTSRDKMYFGDTKVVDDKKMIPLFRYGLTNEPVVKPFTLELNELKLKVQKFCNDSKEGDNKTQIINHLVINRYCDGSDHIGYHHDKIRDLEKKTSIFTITIGETRKFLIKPEKAHQTEYKKTTSVELNNGSMFCLGPETNRKFKHSIPVTKKKKGMRYALTFRSVCNFIQL